MTQTPTPRKSRPGSHNPVGKQQLNVYITEEGRAILTTLLERDGVPFSAQIERALKLWAKEKGIEVSHDGSPKGGAPR